MNSLYSTSASGNGRKKGAPLLAVLMALNLFLVLSAQNDLLSEAVYVSVVPLLLGGVLLLFCPNRSLSANPKTCIAALLLTCLFLVLLPVQSLYEAGLMQNAAPNALRLYFCFLYPVFVALGAYVSISAYLNACLAARETPPVVSETGRAHSFHTEILLLAAAAVTVVFSALPSMRIGDAPTMVHLVENGIWDEWHTAGYLIFVRLLYGIAQSDLAVTLTQAAGYLLVHYYALAVLDRFGCPARARKAYVFIALITFVPIFYLNLMIKDVAFCASLLAFGLSALCCADAARCKKKDFVILALSGFFVSIFRLAGVLPVAATLTALFFYRLSKKHKALPVVFAAAFAAAGFLAVSLFFRTRPDARRNPYYLTYSIPMQMIGALVHEGVEIAPEDAAVLEEIMPVERYGDCFMHYHSDALSREYGAIGSDVKKISEKRLGPALIKVNWHLFTRYPMQYLTAFFDQSSLLWEISTPPDGYTHKILWFPDGYSSAEAPEDCRYTGFAAPVNRYAEFITANPLTYPLLWRGGFAAFMIVLSGAALFFKGRRHDLFLLLPVAVVTFGLFFSLPAQESRYILPNLEFAVFAAVYAYFVKNETSGEKTL